jgi:hypothetical protein
VHTQQRCQPGLCALALVVVVALQDGGVQLVATTRDNVSPSFVLEFLKRISIIIKVRQWVCGSWLQGCCGAPKAVGVSVGVTLHASASPQLSTTCSNCPSLPASRQMWCVLPPPLTALIAAPYDPPLRRAARAGLLWQRE